MDVLLNRGVLANNLTPMLSSGMAPMQCMLGRSDLLSPLENTPQFNTLDSPEKMFMDGPAKIQDHLREILNLRNMLCEIEAGEIIAISQSRNIRANAASIIQNGEEVEVYHPTLKVWR